MTIPFIADKLLSSITALYEADERLSHFFPLPDDVAPQPFLAHHRSASTALQTDTALSSERYQHLVSQLVEVSPHMYWREVYTAQNQKLDAAALGFMEQLGCYAIIGDKAPFCSSEMSLYLVYMPAGMTYPWHKHKAEELYLILTGEAMFCRDGLPDIMATEGQTIIHESQQAHQMRTYDTPYVKLVRLAQSPIFASNAL